MQSDKKINGTENGRKREKGKGRKTKENLCSEWWLAMTM